MRNITTEIWNKSFSYILWCNIVFHNIDNISLQTDVGHLAYKNLSPSIIDINRRLDEKNEPVENSIISEERTHTKEEKILPFLIFKMGINTHKFRHGDIVKLSTARTYASWK